jgi:small subunit ribosomal protein S12
MSTTSQLTKLINRPKKRRKKKTVALEGNPQKLGICTRVFTIKPKKPNSAIRKLTKVRLSNKRHIFAFIPGGKHNLLKYSTVLVRGGRVRDMPGVKYRCISGKYTLKFVNRKTSRSKYGMRKT